MFKDKFTLFLLYLLNGNVELGHCDGDEAAVPFEHLPLPAEIRELPALAYTCVCICIFTTPVPVRRRCALRNSILL